MELIYYSIVDTGDGYAFPEFFETKALAEWHQDHVEKGKGVGKISPPQSVLSFYADLVINNDPNLDDFIRTFFPTQIPYFTVTKGDGVLYIMNNGLVKTHRPYSNTVTEQDRINLQSRLNREDL